MFNVLSHGALVLIGITVMGILFMLIPFEVALPNDIYEFFVDGTITNIFKSISYFIPVNFILLCIIIIFSARYIGILFNMVSWIWNKIFF